MLACMYRFAAYDSEMSFKLCGHRWDEDEYEETLHVQIFRKHLTSLGQEFFDRCWHLQTSHARQLPLCGGRRAVSQLLDASVGGTPSVALAGSIEQASYTTRC